MTEPCMKPSVDNWHRTQLVRNLVRSPGEINDQESYPVVLEFYCLHRWSCFEYVLSLALTSSKENKNKKNKASKRRKTLL